MADISASTVMELRQRTGLGMMECKKALTESDGDLRRPRSCCASRAAPRRRRPRAAWRPKASSARISRRTRKTGAMVEVNCETDFVSRNEDFIAFARKLAQLVAEKNPADVAALAAMPLDGGTVESRARQALVQKIGENMSIRRFVRFDHRRRVSRSTCMAAAASASWWNIDGGDDSVGKDIAMHIAATTRRARPPGLRVARRSAGRPHREGTRDLRRAGGR